MSNKLHEHLCVSSTGLHVHIYHWQKRFEDIKKLIIIVPGMPNYPDKSFLDNPPDSILKHAFCVLYYYGYWFSDGDFTVENCAKSVSDCINYIREGQFMDSFSRDYIKPFTNRIELCGYSFGANPLLRALPNINPNNISRITLAAPLAMIHADDLNQIDTVTLRQFFDFNRQFHKFLSNGYNNLIRDIRSLQWCSYFQGLEQSSIITPLQENWYKKMFLYYGGQDSVVLKPFIEPLFTFIKQENRHILPDLGHDKKLIIISSE